MEHFKKIDDPIHNKTESMVKNISMEEIYQHHANTEAAYVDIFESSSFKEAEPVGISSGFDSSTVFIGSTISVFKPLLEESRVPEDGLILIQPCLRTQNKKHLYDDKDIDYNTYFSIIGGIAPIEKIDEVVAAVVDFLKKIGVSNDRILIQIKSTDKDLMKSLHSVPEANIEEDAKDVLYYEWQYGMDDFNGRGLTIAIKNENSNKFEDIGNIIIVDKKGIPCAVQWGFGLETLLSRVYNKQKPIECSLISQVVEFKPGSRSKFSDALSAVIEIYLSGVKPDNKGAGSQLRDYLKGLSYLKRKNGYSNEDLSRFIKNYLLLKGGDKDADIINKIINYIEKHEQKILIFEEMIAKMKLQKNNNEVQNMLNDIKIKNNWSQLYGLNISEMIEIINT
jgi:hypothetical protein